MQPILVSSGHIIKEKMEHKSQENSTKKQLVEGNDLESIQTIQLLQKHIEKLKKELTIVSEWVRLLRYENNTLKVKVVRFEDAMKVSDLLTRRKLMNLEELLEAKSVQVESLQSAIQILDDENMRLKTEEDILASNERQLKHEINTLKSTIAKIEKKPNVHLSQDTANWKEKMDDDL